MVAFYVPIVSLPITKSDGSVRLIFAAMGYLYLVVVNTYDFY